MENKSPLEILKKGEKVQALNNFLRYKEGHSEEIPEGTAMRESSRNENNSDPDKFNEGFFNRVNIGASMLIGRKIITDPKVIAIIEEFTKFVDKIKEEKFRQGILADQKDIDETNKFLDYIIAELRK